MLGVLGKYGQLPSGISSSTPSTPGGWSPVTLTNGEAGAVTLGQVCYLSAADTARLSFDNGTLAQAQAVCMCIDTTIAGGATGRFVFGGRVAGLAGGAFNTLGYLSTVAGAIAAVPDLVAGRYNVLLGLWTSATAFEFNPQLPILN